MAEPDVVVIGAGAAGLAAARALTAAQIPFLVVEAQNRIGGRARTVQLAGYPVDLGCGWLHSADKNPMTKIARQLGFTIDRTRAPWKRQSGNQNMSRNEQRSFRRMFRNFNKRLKETKGVHDLPGSTFLKPGGRWNSVLDAISTYFSATPLDGLSVRDFRRYSDTEIDWRITEGYGTLFAALAAPLPVILSCAVREIDHSGRMLRLVTSQGVITARKAIVTVSSNALAAGRLCFKPAMQNKIEYASNLPLGLVNKVFFYCDEPLPRDGHFFADTHSRDTGSYHLRPFGQNLIEVYFAGPLAEDMAADGQNAQFDMATEELVGLLGGHIRKRLRPLKATEWSKNPFIGGSYSYARVGYADNRKKLAQDINRRIFFAGEATSPRAFSTAHGAYLSGVRAARQAIRQ